MGQRELFLALFGAMEGQRAARSRSTARRSHSRSPADAVRARHQPGARGPQDRGSVPRASTASENVSLPSLRIASCAVGLVDARREARRCSPALARVQVPTTRAVGAGEATSAAATSRRSPSPNGSLTGSRILLLYDPTRGVDVGTKAEIYRLIHDFAEREARCCSTRPTIARACEPLRRTCWSSIAAALPTCWRAPPSPKRRSCVPRSAESRTARRAGTMNVASRCATPRSVKPVPRLEGQRGTLVALAVLYRGRSRSAWPSTRRRSAISTSARSARARPPWRLAAIGETIVILAGGLDLSAGAVISLVNVVLVTQLGAAR